LLPVNFRLDANPPAIVAPACVLFCLILPILSLPKMLSVANAFEISDHQRNPR
jgi:hypothetical protein